MFTKTTKDDFFNPLCYLIKLQFHEEAALITNLPNSRFLTRDHMQLFEFCLINLGQLTPNSDVVLLAKF